MEMGSIFPPGNEGCSKRKFGEAVDSSLILTKIVKIRCKTLIVFKERDLVLSRTKHGTSRHGTLVQYTS